jgi:hypothetical protein
LVSEAATISKTFSNKTTRQASPLPTLPQKTMSSMNTHTIHVNMSCPEANREVVVYNLEHIEGVGEKKNMLFKGFWKCLPIDICFILDDTSTPHWKARVLSADTVMLSIQAW